MEKHFTIVRSCISKMAYTPILALFTIGLMLLIGCREDDLDSISTPEVENFNNQITSIDGRLKFSSSDFFRLKMEEYKGMDESALESQLTRLYDKEYLPLRPLLTETSQQKYASKFSGLAQSQYRVEYDDDYEELTEFIADDIFATLLNHEGMIQFGDIFTNIHLTVCL